MQSSPAARGLNFGPIIIFKLTAPTHITKRSKSHPGANCIQKFAQMKPIYGNSTYNHSNTWALSLSLCFSMLFSIRCPFAGSYLGRNLISKCLPHHHHQPSQTSPNPQKYSSYRCIHSLSQSLVAVPILWPNLILLLDT